MDRNVSYGENMHHDITPHPSHSATHAPIPLAVSRLVRLATADAPTALAALRPTGTATFEPFQPSAWVPHAWRARGHLRAPGRGRRFRVEFAVDGGAGRPVELSIRPIGRGAHLWGARRLRSYFAASCQAADQLSAELCRLAAPLTSKCADEQVTLAA